MRSLQDLCLSSYLSFLETECKAWIDLTANGSSLLQVSLTFPIRAEVSLTECQCEDASRPPVSPLQLPFRHCQL